MSASKYEDRVQNLSKVIDIAIEAFKKFTPKGWDSSTINHVIKTYSEFKDNALKPEPRYHNTKSLSYIQADVLTYFQEAGGDAVHYFWKQVNEQKLEVKRENKMAAILKRGKIKNRIEYDFIIDVLVPYEQEGLLSRTDVINLNKMIAAFEKK